MNPTRMSAAAVPVLLIFTAFLGVLTLHFDWNVEVVSFLLFLFTLVYVRVFERIIPLKKEWEPNKALIWTDLKYFFLSVAPFDALGKMLALSGVLYLQKQYVPTFVPEPDVLENTCYSSFAGKHELV